jgi:hypothetical protein
LAWAPPLVLGLTTLVWLELPVDDEESDDDEPDVEETLADAEFLLTVAPQTTTDATPASPRLAIVTVAVRLEAILRPRALMSMLVPHSRSRSALKPSGFENYFSGFFFEAD